VVPADPRVPAVLPILFDLSPVLLLPIVVVAALLAVIWVLIHRFASAAARERHPGPQWLRALLILVGLLSILVALPIYYLAVVSESRPVIMPQVVLSNDERTVTFQGMMHVGSESFYKCVVYDLERAKTDGCTMYFEGVQPGTPESDEWFSNTLAGGGDLSASYDALARTCGLEFQLDYFEFLGPEMEAEPDRFVNADVTTADMQAKAERLAKADPGFGEALDEIAEMATGSGTEAVLDGFVRVQNEGTEGQKEIAGIVCRGVMSLLHGGGAGADIFIYADSLDGGDVIDGFDGDAGDRIDLRGLLDSLGIAEADRAASVDVQQSGSTAVVSVDSDPGADGFELVVATVTNVTGDLTDAHLDLGIV